MRGRTPHQTHVPSQRSSPPQGGEHQHGATLEVPDPISALEQEFLSLFPASVGLLGPPPAAAAAAAAAATPTEFLERRRSSVVLGS